MALQEDEDEEQNEYEQDGFIVDDAEEEEEEEEERVAPKRKKKKKRERELRLDDDDYDLLEENQVQVGQRAHARLGGASEGWSVGVSAQTGDTRRAALCQAWHGGVRRQVAVARWRLGLLAPQSTN